MQRSLRLDGAPAFIRAFPHWFARSPMAGAVRAAAAGREAVRPGGDGARVAGRTTRPQ